MSSSSSLTRSRSDAKSGGKSKLTTSSNPKSQSNTIGLPQNIVIRGMDGEFYEVLHEVLPWKPKNEYRDSSTSTMTTTLTEWVSYGHRQSDQLPVTIRRVSTKEWNNANASMMNKIIHDQIECGRKIKHPQLEETITFSRSSHSSAAVYFIYHRRFHSDYLDLSRVLQNIRSWKSCGFFGEKMARHIVFNILEVLAHLETHDLMHDNLRFENIVLSSPQGYKLTTSSTLLDPDHISVTLLECHYRPIGSPKYNRRPDLVMTAPELRNVICNNGGPKEAAVAAVADKSKLFKKTDIWTTGAIMFRLLYPSLRIQKDHIPSTSCLPTSSLSSSPSYSVQCLDVLHQCLMLDQDKRPSATALLNHPFFSDLCNRSKNISSIVTVVTKESVPTLEICKAAAQCLVPSIVKDDLPMFFTEKAEWTWDSHVKNIAVKKPQISAAASTTTTTAMRLKGKDMSHAMGLGVSFETPIGRSNERPLDPLRGSCGHGPLPEKLEYMRLPEFGSPDLIYKAQIMESLTDIMILQLLLAPLVAEGSFTLASLIAVDVVNWSKHLEATLVQTPEFFIKSEIYVNSVEWLKIMVRSTLETCCASHTSHATSLEERLVTTTTKNRAFLLANLCNRMVGGVVLFFSFFEPYLFFSLMVVAKDRHDESSSGTRRRKKCVDVWLVCREIEHPCMP